MEDIKRRFMDTVAARLADAPQSAEKDELVEELADNLYHRFLDMTGAGMDDETAFTRSMDDLGDVDELLAYLGVDPAKDGTTITTKGGQTRIERPDGRTVVINHGDSQPITINSGDGTPITISAGDPAADAERAKADEERAKADEERAREDEERARTDGRGQAPQSDLDSILAGVQEVCNAAIDQAKIAIQQAKDAIQRRTTVEKGDGHVEVHFDTTPDAPTPPEPPMPPEPPTPPEPASGWEFEAEVDTDQGRFFAGAGPKRQRDIIYGFGYDKAKGGFFTQWGEWKGGPQPGSGPRFQGQDASMQGNEDGSYSVGALKDLRGIVVQTVAGDVTIHANQAPDAGVVIDGDVDDLDVTCSADGVLTIREGRTASSSFFSRRGFGSADVELYLPCRAWDLLEITTSSGDVELYGDEMDLAQLTVKTASGDLNCHLRSCGELRFHSASGDLELFGACASLHADTMSGDITLHGQITDAMVKTASGDIETDGAVGRFLGSSMSGDLHLETSQLPQVMELSTKSGDCEARIPDAGPFTLRYKTVSGEVDFAFPFRYQGSTAVYGDGSGPCYSMTTVSGDLSLERY